MARHATPATPPPAGHIHSAPPPEGHEWVDVGGVVVLRRVPTPAAAPAAAASTSATTATSGGGKKVDSKWLVPAVLGIAALFILIAYNNGTWPWGSGTGSNPPPTVNSGAVTGGKTFYRGRELDTARTRRTGRSCIPGTQYECVRGGQLGLCDCR